MFLQGMGQTLFLINVPLFLILTGYLNCHKQLTRNYYKGIKRVAVSYFVFSAVTILFRRYYAHEDLSWLQWLLKVTDFSAIPYGWYIEMWLGLFLITPFLNILWKGIVSERHRRVLIATLYIMTALPDFFNRYGVHLVPGYWEAVYPFLFFFIGAYIREYQPSLSQKRLWLMMVGLCLINPVFNTVAVSNHTMIHLVGDGNGIVGVPLATMFFLCFYRLDVKDVFVKNVLQRVSVLSLDMYLASYMFDILYYSYFETHFFRSQSQFGLFFFVIVPLVFVSSFVVSQVKEWMAKGF